MFGFRTLRRYWLLRRKHIPAPAWRAVLDHVPPALRLNPEELKRLRSLAAVFLHEKTIEGAAGVEVDDALRLLIAVWACLPIVNLGLDWYDGWTAVIVYPGDFRAFHEYTDEAGVVHEMDRVLSGEAWERGPVILSEEAARDPEGHEGNVILHEFAHKLDMNNGAANGMPPLHRGMDRRAWTDALSAAYDDLCRRVDYGEPTPFDPYATTNPGEFFAVMSEEFFLDPALLRAHYPQVYDQFAAFYRQTP